MKIVLRCEKEDCGATSVIKSEAWMDERNIATMYCPKCKSSLVPRTETDAPTDQTDVA